MAARIKDSDSGIYPATVMPDRDWWRSLWPDPEGVMRMAGHDGFPICAAPPAGCRAAPMGVPELED